MGTFASIRDVIAAWPTRRDLASDLGTTVDRVHKWAVTGTIPARYHARILRAAATRCIALTADDLVRVHDVGDAEDAA